MALTTYKVFRKLANADVRHDAIEEGAAVVRDAFLQVGAVNAHSTEHAFRLVGDQHGEGSFAVVSQRSWKEETLEVETTTRVTIKGA